MINDAINAIGQNLSGIQNITIVMHNKCNKCRGDGHIIEFVFTEGHQEEKKICDKCNGNGFEIVTIETNIKKSQFKK